MTMVSLLYIFEYRIEQNFGGKIFGEIVILKHWRKKLWRIQGLPVFSL